MACRGETLTSHNIPQVDEAVGPSSGQEAAVGAKTNSIDLRKVGIQHILSPGRKSGHHTHRDALVSLLRDSPN